MPSLEVCKESNAQYKPATPPVVLVLGGTAGIGRGIAKTLAELTGGALHLVVLGRNRGAADALFAELPHVAGSKYEFAAVDATLMANVRRAAAALAARLTKVNFVVTSCGFVRPWGAPTAEGLNPMVAVYFFARFRFILDVMPLVGAAAAAGERTGVLDIGAAGYGGPVNLKDLDLKGTMARMPFRQRATLATYRDVMFTELSRRYPAVHFVHNFPGLVKTDLMGPVAGALQRMLGAGISAEESAQYSLYPLLSDKKEFRRGVTTVDERANPVAPNEALTEDVIQKVWEFAVARTKGGVA